MPSHHGVRPYNYHRNEAAGPQTVDQDPKDSIRIGQADPRPLAELKNVQLMSQSPYLELHGGSTLET